MTTPRHRSAFFVVVVIAGVLYAAALVYVAQVVAAHFGDRKVFGWDAAFRNGQWIVSSVNLDGPARTLAVGDRLLAIDGDTTSAVLGPYQRWRLPIGATYTVDVERGGERRRAELEVHLSHGPRPIGLIFLVMSLTFFASGAVLGLLRPDNLQARLLAALTIAAAFSFLMDLTSAMRPFYQGWTLYAAYALDVAAGWQFPLTFHFFARFPTGAPPGRVWQLVLYLLYAAALVVAGMRAYWQLVTVIGAPAVVTFLAGHPQWIVPLATLNQGPLQAYLVASIALAMAIAIRTYRRLSGPGDRRRVRWVIVPFVVVLIPWLLLMFVFWILNAISSQTYTALYPYMFLPVALFPLALAYAVLKNQLFDIRLVVRRGLQYLLARNALRAAVALPVVLLAVAILRNPDRTLAEIVTEGSGWVNVLLVGTLGAGLRYRRQLQTGLDRRFFREAYQQEQVLADLIDEVKAQEAVSGIARLVCERVESAMHPSSMHCFYRERERSEMVSGHSSASAPASRTLSDQQALLRIMDGSRSPQDYPFRFDASVPEAERAWLDELGVRLLVPFVGHNDRLVGLLVLGSKKSEEPYSAVDRKLLQAIGGQVGIVYENLHLQERVRQADRVKREVLTKLDDRHVNLVKECPACGSCYDGTDERCTRDGESLELTLPVDRTVDGKYRLDRRLGRGGMGAVYEAEDLRLQRRVAVKVMSGSLFGDQTALRRFEREARTAARLDHPNITRVYDYGLIGSDGAYLVLELLDGRTWRAVLSEAGAIRPARAALWFRQLLAGVGVAHTAGVVHRDLKPENVMIVRAPGGGEALKIMDFGLARVQSSAQTVTETLTAAGVVMGTLGYMSPEQLTGEPADERADIFSIGVMAVEAVTGRRPFTGRTPQEIMTAVLQGDCRLHADTPDTEPLAASARRCLARDPADRYRAVAELAADLIPALERWPGGETESPGVASPAIEDEDTRLS